MNPGGDQDCQLFKIPGPGFWHERGNRERYIGHYLTNKGPCPLVGAHLVVLLCAVVGLDVDITQCLQENNVTHHGHCYQ